MPVLRRHRGAGIRHRRRRHRGRGSGCRRRRSRRWSSRAWAIRRQSWPAGVWTRHTHSVSARRTDWLRADRPRECERGNDRHAGQEVLHVDPPR